jgi:type IV pilus assembly protein PilF
MRLLWLVLFVLLAACASPQERQREEKQSFNVADTNLRLGLGYLRQGREEAALIKLKKSLEARPDYAETHSTIALVYSRLGKIEEAEAHYLTALELMPKNGSIHNNYAVFLCGNGRPLEAEVYFLQAIKSRNYTTPAQAFENLGMCVMQIPDQKKAETYLRKALRINAKLPAALLQMAHISLVRSRAMSGRAYLQRYQEVTALAANGLWLGIQIEMALGDTATVADYKNRLRRYFPDSEELRLLQNAEATQGQ